MLTIRLLGQFAVRLDDDPVEVLTRPAQSLFAYLVLTAGLAHRREKLAGMFWPDTAEVNARANQPAPGYLAPAEGPRKTHPARLLSGR